MKMILGRKVGMISSFLDNGRLIPITVVAAEPNIVLENKTKEQNGYNATKIGHEQYDEKKLNKPHNGIFKKLEITSMKNIREFRDVTGYNVGDEITVKEFSVGEYVNVQSTSIGHGFTGAIKRWNFKCGPKSHGAGYPHRYQGSISFGRGGSQGQRVVKGKKMSGHWGSETVTIKNLLIVGIDKEKNLILIKGSVPGPKKSILLIKASQKPTLSENSINLLSTAQIDTVLEAKNENS